MKPSASNTSLPFSDTHQSSAGLSNSTSTTNNNNNNKYSSSSNNNQQLLNIQIENPVVFPGSIVRGFVTLNSPIPIDNVVALRLKIVGKERLIRKKDEWELTMDRQQQNQGKKKKNSKSSSKKKKMGTGGLRVTDTTGSYVGDEDDDDDDNKNSKNKDDVEETEDGDAVFSQESTCIYKQLVTLFGQTKESGMRDTTRIQAGEYVYPFEFSLPQNIPSSYHTYEVNFGRGALNTSAMMKEGSKSETTSVASTMSHNTYNSEENQIILTNFENYFDSVVRHGNNNNKLSSNNSTSVSSKACIQYYIKSYLDINNSTSLELPTKEELERNKTRLPVFVVPAVPNRQWLDKCPLSVDRQWEVKGCLGCLGNRGSVHCKISLDRSVIALDRDALSATLDFECSGAAEVEKVTMRLISKCRMRIDNQSNHIERLVSVVSDVPIIYSDSGFSDVGNIQGSGGNRKIGSGGKKATTCSGTVNLTCPLTPAVCPPSLMTARLQSTYELQFILDIPGVANEVACHSFPIMITYTVDGENIQPAVNTNANVYSEFDEASRKEYMYHQPSRPVAVPRPIVVATNNNNNSNSSPDQSNPSSTSVSRNGSFGMKKSASAQSLQQQTSFGSNGTLISKQPEASSSRTAYPAQTCWGRPLMQSSHVQKKLFGNGLGTSSSTSQFSRSKSRFFVFADTEWDLPREPLLTARANAADTLRQKKSQLSDRASSVFQTTTYHNTQYASTGHPSSLTPQTNVSLQAPSHRQSMKSDHGPYVEEELMIAVVSSAQHSNATTPRQKSMNAHAAPAPLTSSNFLSAAGTGTAQGITKEASSTAITPSGSSHRSSSSAAATGDANGVNSRQESKNNDDLEAELLLGENNQNGNQNSSGADDDVILDDQNRPNNSNAARHHHYYDQPHHGDDDDEVRPRDRSHTLEYQAPTIVLGPSPSMEGANALL